MKVKCKWCEQIGGVWKCTHPEGKIASETCGWSDREDGVQIEHDYCPDYEPEYENLFETVLLGQYSNTVLK